MRCVAFITIAVSLSSALAASRFEARKDVDRPDPTNLDHCPGRPTGDADRCTFEKQKDLGTRTRRFQVGKPAENCENGPKAPSITSEIGGSHEFTETWSHSNKAEINLLGIKIGGEGGWEKSETRTESQTNSVTVPAGKKTVWSAKLEYKEYGGRIRLNYGDPSGDPGKDNYHYIWYNNDIVSSQPTGGDPAWEPVTVDCDKDFDME
ncbi:hypothetical protein VNI00_002667 [Paramarasmius palmivorus]|uniref:Uncharacterized protein n=1 Tax=Paramarasmius palmivorus TaxID=297713 RepID=A0AAW0DVF9_9AGAR